MPSKGQRPARNILSGNYDRLKQRLGFVPWNPDEYLITSEDYGFVFDNIWDRESAIDEGGILEQSNQIIRNIMK